MIMNNYCDNPWNKEFDFDLHAPETPTKKGDRVTSNFRDSSPKGISDLIVAGDEDYFSYFDDTFELFPSDMDLDVSFLESTPRNQLREQHVGGSDDGDDKPQPLTPTGGKSDDKSHTFTPFLSSFIYDDLLCPLDSSLEPELHDQFNLSNGRRLHDERCDKKGKAVRKHPGKRKTSTRRSLADDFDEPDQKKSNMEKRYSRDSKANLNVQSRSARNRANNTWRGSFYMITLYNINMLHLHDEWF